jgi:branched-chain amino acid transport system substrate-binding protein
VSANGTATTAAAFTYVLDLAKVPIINPYAGAADWYAEPKPLLFSYQTLYESQAAAAGAWAAEEGNRTIAIVRDDPAVFEKIANEVEPAITG